MDARISVIASYRVRIEELQEEIDHYVSEVFHLEAELSRVA